MVPCTSVKVACTLVKGHVCPSQRLRAPQLKVTCAPVLGATPINYCLKSEVRIHYTLLLAMFNLLHSSTNQELPVNYTSLIEVATMKNMGGAVHPIIV